MSCVLRGKGQEDSKKNEQHRKKKIKELYITVSQIKLGEAYMAFVSALSEYTGTSAYRPSSSR
jgi:hypothetical protein